MRWAWLPLGVAIGAYLAMPRVLKRAFAPPSRDVDLTPADLDLPGEHVWFDSSGGTRLHAWFVPVAGRSSAVIVLHGWGANASSMLPLAPHLHRAGYHALFLDARNHGLSEHNDFTSMPRFAEDLEVATGWLEAQPDVGSVGVIGHSVGAGAAILGASRDDRFAAVVAVSAPAHPEEMMREQLSTIPAPVLTLVLEAVQRIIGHRFDSFAPCNRVAFLTVPLMLVHGEADEVVPIRSLHELSEAHPAAETLVVTDAGHSDLAAFEAHIGDVIDFLDRHLRPPTTGYQTR